MCGFAVVTQGIEEITFVVLLRVLRKEAPEY